MLQAGTEYIPAARLRVIHGGAVEATSGPAGEPGEVRMFLIGGDALARAGVVALLGAHAGITCVGDDEPGPRALAALRARRPDVLVLHGLHDPHEIEALLSEAGRDLPVLAVGGGEPDARTGSLLHGHLSAATTARQLAAAVSLAAAGYALTRGPQPAPDAAPASPAPRGAPAGPRDGAPVSSVSDVAPEELTGRENQVLGLVARGLSNTEIAQDLTLSEHTVKTHVQNLLHKLRLRNRVHVAIYAFEAGLR